MKFIILLLTLFSTAFAAEKPNIIFIMTDDQGYGVASSYNPESKNLVDEKPDIVAELTKLLETAVANGRTTPGPNRKNDAKVVIWKDGAGRKKAPNNKQSR